jgi:hypothetical protein
MLRASVLACGLVMWGVGCSSPPEATLVDPGLLAGQFNGRPWNAAIGTSARFTPDSNEIHSTLSEVSMEACHPEGTEQLVLDIPFKPGIYRLDLAHTVHFVTPASKDDLAATEGELIVHEVTETTIKAGLYAIYNANPKYEVSGQFTIHRCPF